jgi:hypothetical protein
VRRPLLWRLRPEGGVGRCYYRPMPTKPPAPSEPADYRRWESRAAALIEGQGISAGAIPEKIWRVFYVNRQATPEKAAEEARVHYENFHPPVVLSAA